MTRPVSITCGWLILSLPQGQLHTKDRKTGREKERETEREGEYETKRERERERERQFFRRALKWMCVTRLQARRKAN